MKYEIQRELRKWEEKAIFNVAFKPNTKANLNRLREILHNISLEHFVTISANSEALVYKICRFFIEEGTKADDIALIQGKIIESYIADDSAEWAKRVRIDDFFQIFGETFRGKWVAIPIIKFDNPITVGLAIYFITQFRKYNVIGVIFYSEGNSNLAEVLSLESEDPYFFEFPRKRYLKRKRTIEDDEW